MSYRLQNFSLFINLFSINELLVYVVILCNYTYSRIVKGYLMNVFYSFDTYKCDIKTIYRNPMGFKFIQKNMCNDSLHGSVNFYKFWLRVLLKTLHM